MSIILDIRGINPNDFKSEGNKLVFNNAKLEAETKARMKKINDTYTDPVNFFLIEKVKELTSIKSNFRTSDSLNDFFKTFNPLTRESTANRLFVHSIQELNKAHRKIETTERNSTSNTRKENDESITKAFETQKAIKLAIDTLITIISRNAHNISDDKIAFKQWINQIYKANKDMILDNLAKTRIPLTEISNMLTWYKKNGIDIGNKGRELIKSQLKHFDTHRKELETSITATRIEIDKIKETLKNSSGNQKKEALTSLKELQEKLKSLENEHTALSKDYRNAEPSLLEISKNKLGITALIQDMTLDVLKSELNIAYTEFESTSNPISSARNIISKTPEEKAKIIQEIKEIAAALQKIKLDFENLSKFYAEHPLLQTVELDNGFRETEKELGQKFAHIDNVLKKANKLKESLSVDSPIPESPSPAPSRLIPPEVLELIKSKSEGNPTTGSETSLPPSPIPYQSGAEAGKPVAPLTPLLKTKLQQAMVAQQVDESSPANTDRSKNTLK